MSTERDTERDSTRDTTRDSVVAALLALSRSTSHLDRTDAGVALARFAESVAAADRLVELVCDPDDTYVTRWTTAALVERGDTAAWVVLARACAVADDDTSMWIGDGLGSGLRMLDSARRAAIATCTGLADHPGHPDPVVRVGAAVCLELLDEVAPLTPLLDVTPERGQGSST